ncbi:MAG: hypothetical protein ACREPL_15250 [Rhodanobacteraceae bacterium]
MNTVMTTTLPTPSQRSVRSARIGLLVAALFGIVLPAMLLVWQAATPPVVLRSGAAGRFVSASIDNAFLQATRTDVHTTRGSVVVNGLFSAPYGQALEVVKENHDRGQYLCATGTLATGVPVAGTWAGPMLPAAHVAHAFDFARYGLATDNLWDWLACGVLACVFGVALWLIALAIDAELKRGDDDSRRLAGPAP